MSMATEHCTHRWRPRGGRGRDRHGVSSGRIWSLHASLLSAPDSCALTARAAVGWIALESSAWRSGRGAGWNGSGSGEPLGHLGRTQVRFTAGVEGVPVSGDEAAEEGGRETPSPDRVWVAPGRGGREPPCRRECIAAPLADLKLPGALEALDGRRCGVDGGGTTASEAIEGLLAAPIARRNRRRPTDGRRSRRCRTSTSASSGRFSGSRSTRSTSWASWSEGRTSSCGVRPGWAQRLEPSAGPTSKTRIRPAPLEGEEIGTLRVRPSGAVRFVQRGNRRDEPTSTELTWNPALEPWGQILGEQVMAVLVNRVRPCGHSDRRRRAAELSKGAPSEDGVKLSPSGQPCPEGRHSQWPWTRSAQWLSGAGRSWGMTGPRPATGSPADGCHFRGRA